MKGGPVKVLTTAVQEDVIALAKKVLTDEEYVVLSAEDADEIYMAAGDVHEWVNKNPELVPEQLKEMLEALISRLRHVGLAD